MSRIIGLDYGTKNVGVAITDSSLMIAVPLKIIKTEHFWIELQEIVIKENIDTVVLGNPLNADGTVGERSVKMSRLAEEITRKLKVKVLLKDERFTTLQARSFMQECGVSEKKARKRYDLIAGTIILQEYLDGLK